MCWVDDKYIRIYKRKGANIMTPYRVNVRRNNMYIRQRTFTTYLEAVIYAHKCREEYETMTIETRIGSNGQ